MFLYRDNPADADNFLAKYDIHMFVEDARLNGKIIGYAGVTLYPIGPGSARLIEGVHHSTYKVYDNGIDIMWKIR